MTESGFKPCPFCGGTEVRVIVKYDGINKNFVIAECGTPSCLAMVVGERYGNRLDHDTAAGFIAERWNRRKGEINAKGETIYTSAEIAYELGISPATVNAVGKRLFGGGRIPHWTLNDARLICEYVKSSVEEDAKRLAILHDAVKDIFGDTKLDDVETKRRVNNDIHLAGRW